MKVTSYDHVVEAINILAQNPKAEGHKEMMAKLLSWKQQYEQQSTKEGNDFPSMKAMWDKRGPGGAGGAAGALVGH